MRGIIKWFDPKKGYGFIKTEDRDVFVHYSQIQTFETFKLLLPGDKVEFDCYENIPGKYEAKYVIKL